MAISRFTPAGFLDVATDPGEMAIMGDEKAGAIGKDMVRCTNLTLDRLGIAKTRPGSQKVSSTQLSTPIWRIVEQGGVRYAFAGTSIYQNEVEIVTGLTSARWSSVKYNAFNVEDQSIFAVNGTDRKRITGGVVNEWGIDKPASPPTLTGQVTGYAYTYEWEATFTALNTDFDYSADPDLIVYLPFDDGSGNGNLTEYAGSKTFAALGTAAASTSAAIFDSHGLLLDGSGGGIATSDISDLDFSADGLFTFQTEIEINPSAGSSQRTLFHHGTDANNFHRLSIDTSLLKYEVWIGGVSYVFFSGTYVMSSAVKYDITLVSYDLGGGFTGINTYINGYLDKSVIGYYPGAYTGDFTIGSDDDGSKTFYGKIDDTRIWASKKYSTNFTKPTQAYRYTLATESSNPGFKWTRSTDDGAYEYVYDWEPYQVDGEGGPDDSVSQHGIWFWEFQTGYTITNRFGIAITYVRRDAAGEILECESNPSDVVYMESGSGIIVNWDTPTDPQVTHVRIYRTFAGGTAFFLSDEFEASLGVGALSKQDSELTTDLEYDHDRPPAGGTIVLGPDFNGYLFIAVGNKLYFSKAKQPEYWPAIQYVEVSPIQDPIKALGLFNGQVHALPGTDIVQILGTGFQSFAPVRQSAVTGAIAQDGILGLKGYGFLRVANDGLWEYTGAKDTNVTNPRFRQVFQGDTAGSIPGINETYKSNSWIVAWRSRVYHGFPGAGLTYPSEILRTDLGSMKVTHLNYGLEFSCITVDETNDRLLAGDSDGYIWILEDESVTTDGGTAIAWQVESQEFSQLYKYFPRYAKYDVDLQNGAAANGRILLDGTIKQTHVLGDRKTKKRHITGCTGDRLSVRIDGTGPVSIYSAEVQ